MAVERGNAAEVVARRGVTANNGQATPDPSAVNCEHDDGLVVCDETSRRDDDRGGNQLEFR